MAAPERRRPTGAVGRVAARLPDGVQPGRGAGPARAAAGRRVDLRRQRPRRHGAQRELLRARQRAGRPAGAGPGNREHRQAAQGPGADRRAGALIPDPRRGGLHRRFAAPGERAPRRRRVAQPSARAAGGSPAPDTAGRTDPRAQRADRRRPGRSGRPARRAAGAPRDGRGPLRRAGHAAGRQPGAPRTVRRQGDRSRARAEPGARAAALAGAHRAGSRLRAAQSAGAPERAAARHGNRGHPGKIAGGRAAARQRRTRPAERRGGPGRSAERPRP